MIQVSMIFGEGTLQSYKQSILFFIVWMIYAFFGFIFLILGFIFFARALGRSVSDTLNETGGIDFVGFVFAAVLVSIGYVIIILGFYASLIYAGSRDGQGTDTPGIVASYTAAIGIGGRILIACLIFALVGAFSFGILIGVDDALIRLFALFTYFFMIVLVFISPLALLFKTSQYLRSLS